MANKDGAEELVDVAAGLDDADVAEEGLQGRCRIDDGHAGCQINSLRAPSG